MKGMHIKFGPILLLLLLSTWACADKASQTTAGGAMGQTGNVAGTQAAYVEKIENRYLFGGW